MENKNPSFVQSMLGWGVGFIFIFTILSLIFIPKWKGLDAEQMRGLYQEEDNSIDVLMLGSCNIYSSYSPVIAYEQYGITSYVYGCPDQELVISYHYLKEALKTQDIKAVVLESLFLTCEPTIHREYYNRTALEYLRPSINKAQLILELGGMESEYMQTVDNSAPDKLLTYAGYFFPLLRYHGREDVTEADITFYFERDDYSKLKGGKPLFSYLNNTTLDFDYVLNGTKIRDTSREYFIKIQELCEEKGIEFVLVKSPNHYRWNEESTSVVKEFAEEQGVPFLDMEEIGDFMLTDYSTTTGRLNIYGMKKFSEIMGEFLTEDVGIQPHKLSAENKALWDDCVESLHTTANKKEMTIDEGQIYKIYNEVDGIRLLWNRCLDGNSYTVYRSEGKKGKFKKLDDVNVCTYLDKTVEPGKGYTYYIIPNEGGLAGHVSNEAYYVFLDAPTNAKGWNSDGAVRLSWNGSNVATKYDIDRKSWDSLNYSNWDTTTKTTYPNFSCNSGMLYNYRIRGMLEEGDITYYSAGEVIKAIPITTPEITSVSSKSGVNTIKWNEIANGSEYKIYRRSEKENNFILYDTAPASAISYEDQNVEEGVEYFYKIVMSKTKLDVTENSFESNTVGVITKPVS